MGPETSKIPASPAQAPLIKKVYMDNPNKIHHFFKFDKVQITNRLREEWDEWLHATTLQLTRCWIPHYCTNKKVVQLHTDASQTQLGALLYIQDEFKDEFKFVCPEYWSNWTIAVKEMMAIYLAIIHFAEYLVDTTIWS